MVKLVKNSLLGIAFVLPACADPVAQGSRNVPEFEPAFATQTRAPAVVGGIALHAEALADGLSHPWGIEVLPGGGYLVTERGGGLRVIAADGSLRVAPVGGVPDVMANGQGGLLDVALAEDFDASGIVYLSYAKPFADGTSATAVARATLNGDMTKLDNVTDIFVQDPPYANSKHFGSRVVPHDGLIFITMGERSDATTRARAQDLDKTYGKIVRVTPDGDAAPDNPFINNPIANDTIWSLGHRNVQGAAIRPETGELWALEHGPKGGDELNRIERGANYGWPVVSYGEEYSGRPIARGEHSAEGFTEPRYYWDPVIAPGGFAFYQGDMFPEWRGNIIASSLSPGGINRLVLDGDTVIGEEKLLQELGRVRDVEIDADGALLLLLDKSNGAVMRVTRD